MERDAHEAAHPVANGRIFALGSSLCAAQRHGRDELRIPSALRAKRMQIADVLSDEYHHCLGAGELSPRAIGAGWRSDRHCGLPFRCAGKASARISQRPGSGPGNKRQRRKCARYAGGTRRGPESHGFNSVGAYSGIQPLPNGRGRDSCAPPPKALAVGRPKKPKCRRSWILHKGWQSLL